MWIRERRDREGSCSDTFLKITCGKAGGGDHLGSQQNNIKPWASKWLCCHSRKMSTVADCLVVWLSEDGAASSACPMPPHLLHLTETDKPCSSGLSRALQLVRNHSRSDKFWQQKLLADVQVALQCFWMSGWYRRAFNMLGSLSRQWIQYQSSFRRGEILEIRVGCCGYLLPSVINFG